MNAIDYEARKAIYEKALWAWGTEAQLMMVIEEMSELTKALCKLRRSNDTKEALNSVADECADVTIMLEQLRLILGINDMVCDHMDYKIERLAARLGAEIGKDGG